MKRPIEPFGNDHIQLRLIEERDLPTTLTWRNEETSRIWFKTSTPLSFDQHMTWYRNYVSRTNDFLFVVEADARLVGQASVYGIDWEERTAEIGRFLAAPAERGRGLINQACEMLVKWCDAPLGLKYIFLEVLENNHRAINIYISNGFVEERRYNGLIRMGKMLQRESNV